MNVLPEKSTPCGCFLYPWGENVFYPCVTNLKTVVPLFTFVLKNTFETALFTIYMPVLN